LSCSRAMSQHGTTLAMHMSVPRTGSEWNSCSVQENALHVGGWCLHTRQAGQKH
jgi:hypothetical protein